MNNRHHLIIDACVLINLLASGMLERILRIAARQSSVCVLVRSESIFLRNETDPAELISIDIQPHVDDGLIEIHDLETDAERELFVNLAASLDDGEAMSLALALSRNWHVATDDKKARRIFLENTSAGQELVSTSLLIEQWAEAENIGQAEIKSVLTRIEKSARFQPAGADANYQWWLDNAR